MKMIKTEKGFTLVELLVVIAIIALLMSILMPGLNKARGLAQKVKCAAQMRQFCMATATYASENNDEIPYFGAMTNKSDEEHPKGPFWYEVLAPYLLRGKKDKDYNWEDDFYSNDAYVSGIRKCPGGKETKRNEQIEHDCWIGVNFGVGNNPNQNLSAPYFYRKSGGMENPPLRISQLKDPSTAMAYTDTRRHYVYSPMNGRFSMFDTDYDGDGELDTSTRASWAPYNEARPKVHNGGCNVGLLDGHASYVKFNDFWEIDENREMKHPYWKIRK